ncbi:hypothetical protein Scep_017428 [Stephania cephalantha]|uniref:Uncharacterized protein n=1 Tax=Stephania cephalantha TaxID=152367 RepID=A0AAP0NVN6_9MAGN
MEFGDGGMGAFVGLERVEGVVAKAAKMGHGGRRRGWLWLMGCQGEDSESGSGGAVGFRVVADFDILDTKMSKDHQNEASLTMKRLLRATQQLRYLKEESSEVSNISTGPVRQKHALPSIIQVIPNVQ